jgi:hypothetical protein
VEEAQAWIDTLTWAARGGVDLTAAARLGSDFAMYLAGLKETHRRKTAFLAGLGRAGF